VKFDTYHVIISELADGNLEATRKYLKNEIGEDFTTVIMGDIIGQIHELKVFPYRFPIIDAKHNLRRMVVEKYKYNVFYKIEGDVVKIYHVPHQAQNPVF